jgi:hypothetical protein
MLRCYSLEVIVGVPVWDPESPEMRPCNNTFYDL